MLYNNDIFTTKREFIMHSIGTMAEVRQGVENRQEKGSYLTIFTIADDEKYAGYANTVKALGVMNDKDYVVSENHHGSLSDKGEINDTFLTKMADETIRQCGRVCVLFAGGGKCYETIEAVQKETRKKLGEKLEEKSEILYRRIMFVLNSERLDNAVSRMHNLDIITQETSESLEEKGIDIQDDVKIHSVDIAATADRIKFEKDADKFMEENKELSSWFEQNIVEQTNHFFYLGGRGEGFSDEDGIDIVKEYKKFVDECFNIEQDKEKPLVIFTNGFRSFTKLDKTNNFVPINEMYKRIQEKIGDKQEAYIFSQKEGENDTRKPVLVEITKDKIIKNEINGNPYAWSLMMAANHDISVSATYEQQNFPIEASSVGILANKISGIDWKLKNGKIHNKLYNETMKKENIKTASGEFPKMLEEKVNQNEIYDIYEKVLSELKEYSKSRCNLENC